MKSYKNSSKYFGKTAVRRMVVNNVMRRGGKCF